MQDDTSLTRMSSSVGFPSITSDLIHLLAEYLLAHGGTIQSVQQTQVRKRGSTVTCLCGLPLRFVSEIWTSRLSMQKNIHIYIHACIHAYIHTYIHTITLHSTPLHYITLIPNSSMTVGFQSLGLGVVPPPTAEPKIRNRNPGTLEP